MGKAKEALGSEGNTDKVPDKAKQLGENRFGESKADQIKEVCGMADERPDDKK